MEDNIEDIFNEENDKIVPVVEDERKEDFITDAPPSGSFGDRILQDIEEDYKGIATKSQERKKERLALEKKLADKQTSLKKCKNVKNHRKTDINTKIAEKRKKLREEITQIKDELYNLALEEKGSQTTSESLVEGTTGGVDK